MKYKIKDLFRDWQALDELKYNLRAGPSRLRADLKQRNTNEGKDPFRLETENHWWTKHKIKGQSDRPLESEREPLRRSESTSQNDHGRSVNSLVPNVVGGGSWVT